MVILPMNRDVRAQWAEVGRTLGTAAAWLLYAAGWLPAKVLRAATTGIAAALFGVGWLAAGAWRALCWCGRAVRLGWREGRKPAVSR